MTHIPFALKDLPYTKDVFPFLREMGLGHLALIKY